MTLPAGADHEHALRDRFAQLLDAARHNRRLSQEQVAHLAGIDVGTYRRIEARSRTGGRRPSPRFDTVLKLLIALRIDVDEIAGIIADPLADD